MDTYAISLTVYFQEPFWIGVFERKESGRLSICKVTFGAEPKEYDANERNLSRYAESIADTFSDITELIGQCAYSNCSHRTEPGCVIRRALEGGTLSPERGEMYARLERENRWSMDRKKDQMVSIALRRRELNHTGKKRGY